MKTSEKGRFGEDLACRFLIKKGYNILERNYRSRYGEIDIIAENENNLVFAEVKLRKNADFALPSQFVDSRKIRRISQTAGVYLGNADFCNKTIRFDIIEIVNSSPPLIRHIENAFYGEV